VQASLPASGTKPISQSQAGERMIAERIARQYSVEYYKIVDIVRIINTYKAMVVALCDIDILNFSYL